MTTPSELLGVEDARARILALTTPLPEESTPIEAAIGRALARDVIAQRTLPPWDNSAMDGYAVRAEDVRTAPVRLQVIDQIFAGQRPNRPIGRGQCARIMTGAPLPEGADAVVMQEHTRPGDGEVEILRPVEPRTAVRDRGEDARAGELLLGQGTPLGIPESGLLWAQGLTHAPVPRRPKVAIVSTGDELCPIGRAEPDKIVDTNSPSLAAAVRRAGGEPTVLGIARDELEEVKELLSRGLDHDVLLTSAGVSVGERDFVRAALESLGVELRFWRVALKPGKPLAVGTRGRTVVFGLPGNPTSSLVTFELFVRPALRRLLGHREVEPPVVPGVLATAYRKPAGLAHYVRAVARWSSDRWVAEPLASQTSGALRSAARATHLVEIPREATELPAGSPVRLIPVSWAG